MITKILLKMKSVEATNATNTRHHQTGCGSNAGWPVKSSNESKPTVLLLWALKKLWLSKEQAGGFYCVHRERPFFDALCAFISRSPVIVLCLEKENAIADWRKLMGATNPADAAPGTIRKDFAVSLNENSVHGSDAPESAAYEIPYFFNALELL